MGIESKSPWLSFVQRNLSLPLRTLNLAGEGLLTLRWERLGTALEGKSHDALKKEKKEGRKELKKRERKEGGKKEKPHHIVSKAKC